MKNELKKVDAILEDNIRYLLNNMNIRHNNKEEKNASEYIANLTDEELECGLMKHIKCCAGNIGIGQCRTKQESKRVKENN